LCCFNCRLTLSVLPNLRNTAKHVQVQAFHNLTARHICIATTLLLYLCVCQVVGTIMRQLHLCYNLF
jgi:hypothetical protein